MILRSPQWGADDSEVMQYLDDVNSQYEAVEDIDVQHFAVLETILGEVLRRLIEIERHLTSAE